MNDSQFEENIRSIINGDKNGLHHIYEAYITYIYSIIYDILKNKEDAEDVTTEFFIKLWKVADKYQFGGKHRAWMGKIAHNMAIDYIRTKKNHVSYEEEPEMIKMSHGTFEEQSVQKLILKDAMETLEETEWEIVTMKILGQLTFREIASILKKPIGTVSWKYKQAIGKLRGVMHEK